MHSYGTKVLLLRRVTFALAAATTLTTARAQSAPDELVKAIAKEVTAILAADPSVLSDAHKRQFLIEAKLLPHFDFERMTQMAMGRNWSKASTQQQALLVQEFRVLLVRNYSGALEEFRDAAIVVRPTRASPDDFEVLVSTVVKHDIKLDYALERHADGRWRVYDVTLAGISLITSYRNEFSRITRDLGVEALLSQLQTTNRQQ